MKTPKDNNPLRVTLKCFALAVTAGVGLGVGNAQAAPANDNFADAIELVGDSGSQTGTGTVDATFEVDEPECVYPEATNTVWFKWTCTQAGFLTLSTNGSTSTNSGNWDAVLGVYTGATLSTLTQLVEQDSGGAETVSMSVAPGTYYIQACGDSGSPPDDTADVNLTWSWSLPTLVDVAGYITNPNDTIVTVGGGNTANMTADMTFGWQTGGCGIPVINNGFLFSMDSGGGNYYNHTGGISGTGGLVIGAGGVDILHLGGSVGNTYSGATVVNSGPVSLEKISGNALCGAITVQGTPSGSFPGMASVVWTAANQIDDASNVTLTSTASLDLDGFTDTINDLYLVTGSVVHTGAGGILKVAHLYLDNEPQPDVAKIAGDGFVTGSGYIEVGASGPPVIETAPDAPTTPTPVDTTTTVHPALLAELDWADSSGATSYDVYLVPASDPDPEPGVTTPTANVALSKYTLGSQVLSLTSYKWQVVAKNAVGDTAGPLWTFSTVDRTQVAGNFSSGYSDGTHNLNFIVGVGNSATLLGNFRVHWSGGSGSFSVPVDTNGFILDADTGGGNGGHNASGPISGGGSLVITHGPHSNGTWNLPYTISGATPNTYSGGTLIKRGLVLLTKTAGVDALPATAITLGSSGTTARLLWGASNQINDLAEISVLLPTVSDGATADANMNYLDLAGYSDTIASLTLPDDGTKTQVRTGAGGVLTVTTLMVNGVPKGPGTYDFNDGFVTGSGSVVVAGAGVTFASWAASKGLVEGDAAFDADPDKDGIKNSIEFVIGGEPNPANPGSNSCALLPTVEAQGDDLVITFTRMDDAAYLNPVIEFDANLQGEWTTAVDPDNATIEINPGSPADTITVTIPKGANTELFARMKVVEP